jgi:hypothetical protein
MARYGDSFTCMRTSIDNDPQECPFPSCLISSKFVQLYQMYISTPSPFVYREMWFLTCSFVSVGEDCEVCTVEALYRVCMLALNGFFPPSRTPNTSAAATASAVKVSANRTRLCCTCNTDGITTELHSVYFNLI